MIDILNITGEPIFDDRIVKIETHTYNPFANTTFGYSDEIRIPIQQQDLYTLPCGSFLYVEGRLTVKKKNDQTPTTLVNNCVAFMFDEIRYELNGVEIDRSRNAGITSTLKNYVSLTYDKALIALNAGWNSRSDTEEGHFNFCEVAVLRKGAILSHYIFTCPMPWSFLTKSEKYCASWLSAYHHGLQWEDGMIPYTMVKRLITMAVIGVEENDDNKTLIYVKGHEKREWQADVLDSDNLTIETLDADYKDIDSLHNLDITNTIGKYIKNCALQNVFKIHNWWSQRQKKMYQV
ncbi:hypothetical protein ALC57_11991 [Trachymyrmex cornetzi]|uniref:Double jelly roll-like domain-containing protein n=1 Tax=Trachymyrmex cornetzi TaxID=471704 RepID=A0A151J1N0_9HYME|nr:hypothetical protein ALC57_11991 [Trachymyrmex cornetzi]